jgi:hypothetical protein
LCMCQVVLSQYFVQAPLPQTRYLPEKKAGTILWLIE